MKKYKSLLFLITPAVQILYSAKYFKSYKQVLSSIIFLVSSFLISLLIYKIFNYLFSKNEKNRKSIILLSTLILTFFDQAHKYILERTKINCNILGELLQIKQTKNINQTAVFNLFDIKLNSTLIIIIKVVTLLIVVYAFIKVKDINLKIGCTLITAAQLSSTIDSLFRGYILDSFYFYRLVCYDLKDYYVDAGVVILIIALFFEQNAKEKLQSETQQ